MENQSKREELLKQLEDKFGDIGQDLNTHLEGLLYSEPMTYWDYVQTDALLNLQTQRTMRTLRVIQPYRLLYC